MPIRLSETPNDHYHRILINALEPDMFSEVFHSHEFTGKGHTHQVTISRAYKKVEQEV